MDVIDRTTDEEAVTIRSMIPRDAKPGERFYFCWAGVRNRVIPGTEAVNDFFVEMNCECKDDPTL